MQIDQNHTQILRAECWELAVANMVTVRNFEVILN